MPDDVVVVESGDGFRLTVEKHIAFRCGAIKKQSKESTSPGTPIIFSNVSGAALVRVSHFP